MNVPSRRRCSWAAWRRSSSSTLLLLQFLDNPFHEGVGGLRPVAMERTLRIIDQELGVAGEVKNPPCDAKGNPA